MSRHSSVFVIFNPAAGRGRGLKRIKAFQALLDQHLPGYDHATTSRAGDEVELVDDALAKGYESIIAVGGDGTWSIAADRVVRSGRRDVRLGLLPAGTGNDFGKSLGVVYENAEGIVRGIAQGRTRTVDVGAVDDRHFLNIVGVGFDIAVIDDAAGFPILKGDALYQFCALRQLFRFRGMPLRIARDGAAAEQLDHLMLVIANANYFGGSFLIAPNARLDDGKLDAVSILNTGPISRARLFSRVGKGRHEGDPKVRIQTGASFTVEFDRPFRYEADGEVYESRGNRITVACVPHALNVFVPA